MKRTLSFIFCSLTLMSVFAQPKGVQMDCPSFSFPYSESFEEYGGSDVVRECWLNLGNNAAYPCMSTFKAENSEHSVYFNSYNGDNLSAVPINGSFSMNNAELVFSAYSPATGSRIVVGVLNNPNMPSTFVPIDTVLPHQVGHWERFNVSFRHYAGSSHHLCFRSTGLNEIYLDNISLRTPQCEQVLPAYENYESFDRGTNDCWTNVTVSSFPVIDYNPIDTSVFLNYNYFYRTDSIYRHDSIFATEIVERDFPYTGSYQTYNAQPGTYTLQVWGAQGGYRSGSSYGGAGGYATGTLTLVSPTTLYIYVGGSGNSGGTSGGFNGGGMRATYAGGGGGTDFRINGTTWYHRVIVAGGGGSCGASSYGGFSNYGYGGGTSGGSGYNGCGTEYGYGTQTGNSYSTETYYTDKNTSSNYGGFGFGGYGSYYASGYGGAGGGGWYGGGGCYPDGSVDDDGGGGGGSGYVYTSSTASNYPAGCQLNSSYYLTNAYTTAGNQSFPSTTGSTETGHAGDGYARLTGPSTVFDHINTVFDHLDTVIDHFTIDTILTYYSHSLLIQPAGADPSIVASPRLENVEDLQLNSLSFDIFCNANESIEVGMMTDLNAASFYPFATAQTVAHSWQHVTCNGISNDLLGNHLAFKSSSSLPVYIDNLNFLDAQFPEPIDSTGIRQYDSENCSLKIIPNPAQDFIEILAPEHEQADADIEIFNIFGSLVKKSPAETRKIAVADLANGVYIVKKGKDKGKFVKKQ